MEIYDSQLLCHCKNILKVILIFPVIPVYGNLTTGHILVDIFFNGIAFQSGLFPLVDS